MSSSTDSMSTDDKITCAIETLSNMTDFGSFKTTMLAKQSASSTGGNFYGANGAVETIINDQGMNIEVLTIDSLFEASEKLRYAAAEPDNWTRFGESQYKNGEFITCDILPTSNPKESFVRWRSILPIPIDQIGKMNNADEVYMDWLNGGKTPEWMLFNDAIKDMKFISREQIDGEKDCPNGTYDVVF